ncbi:MAG: flagellar hook-basal body protein [Thiovulaceae bacterium]|nr:flagellar hook-basal body protein [Sulfurimonadaceae bacterium]MCW9026998.1 flagellar hook-basal body protein [Sulfurimonadaceae bacterium]
MQTGYYGAAAGMVVQFNRLDNIANNLANVNTNGFKEDNVVVGDFMRLYKEARDELPNANQTKEAAQFVNRTMTRTPHIVDEYTNHNVGSMQKTQNDLDVALSREGLFFLVKTPQGIRLTRDGSFIKDNEGKLTTKQGYEVLPSDYFTSQSSVSFEESDSLVEIDKNGQIYTNVPGSLNQIQKQKLFVANPDNLNMLEKVGDNLFEYKGTEKLKALEESGAVFQGFVEKSNVNPVKMMTEMIETNRLVGMYQKVMDSQMNDMNRDAIEKIAKKA